MLLHVIAIMQRNGCNRELQQMINNGIRKGIYIANKDRILSGLRNVQDILRRNFEDKFARHEDMRPVSNLLGRI